MADNQSVDFQRVLDFGLSPADIQANAQRQPRTDADFAAAIVSEEDLLRLGRWGGFRPPARRTRF